MSGFFVWALGLETIGLSVFRSLSLSLSPPYGVLKGVGFMGGRLNIETPHPGACAANTSLCAVHP